jgi:hypothetical protein
VLKWYQSVEGGKYKLTSVRLGKVAYTIIESPNINPKSFEKVFSSFGNSMNRGLIIGRPV